MPDDPEVDALDVDVPEPPDHHKRRHRRSVRLSAGAVILVLSALLGFAIPVQVRLAQRVAGEPRYQRGKLRMPAHERS